MMIGWFEPGLFSSNYSAGDAVSVFVSHSCIWRLHFMAELYSFHVAVKEMEDKIWRDIDISAKSTLAQLAYTIMVVFNTGRDHMFCLYYKGKRYELRFDPDGPKASRPNRCIWRK